MALYRPKYRDKQGTQKSSVVWWYDFTFAGRRINESTKTTKKTLARTTVNVDADERRG